jgi:hypothetical protein
LRYEQLEKLKAGEPQISTISDARALLIVQGQVVEIHSISSSSRCKHNLVRSHTINKNDRSALSAIAIEAKGDLGMETYTTGGQRIS